MGQKLPKRWPIEIDLWWTWECSEIDVQDLLFEDQIFSEAAEVQLKGAAFDNHRTEELPFSRGLNLKSNI